MRITIIGSGYVGLVTGTCFADAGNHVVCVDIDAEKVRLLSAGRSPIYEPGLEELLQANIEAGRLRFTTALEEGVSHSDIIFIAVGTPPLADGSADLSGVESIVRGIAAHMTSPKMVVIKSTVPVGTGERMSQLLEESTAHPFAVVSNPEFLREGAALEDFLRPDRVVIGCDNPEALEVLRELYAPFAATTHTVQVMSRKAAEMVKYASNAYLASRISFINEIAEICARTDVDINQVRAGMGADRRIGSKFLNPGAGYGGSCFPKDVQALIQVAGRVNCDAEILRAVHARNERQKRMLADMVLNRFGEDLTGRCFAIWGLAFKPNTDDVRQAPAIDVIGILARSGAKLNCYDPKATFKADNDLPEHDNVRFVADPYEAVQGADGLIICTEWNEFRTPDFDRIRAALNERVIFDGRNLYEPSAMSRRRIEYHSIGRPVAAPWNGFERRRAFSTLLR
jgi:UDPglucose 6-dehydrogenase